MTLYETLINMLGVLVDRTIGLFSKPKEDCEKVQRILKESADEFALRCEEDPALRSRVQQEMRADVTARLTVREGRVLV